MSSRILLMSVLIPRSPACRMCASACTRSSCPAIGSCPTARTEFGPSSLNLTCDAPSSRFMSSNDSSTVPCMLPTVAPVRELGRSPMICMSFAVASTLASDTRSAARSGMVTSTWSSRLPTTCVRNGNPLMSTSGAAFRCSDSFIFSAAACCAYSTANRSDSAEERHAHQDRDQQLRRLRHRREAADPALAAPVVRRRPRLWIVVLGAQAQAQRVVAAVALVEVRTPVQPSRAARGLRARVRLGVGQCGQIRVRVDLLELRGVARVAAGSVAEALTLPAAFARTGRAACAVRTGCTAHIARAALFVCVRCGGKVRGG
ncbi:hypothetical protein SRIMM317S_06632 [Streptomyces rimosus subsp. rimosus]